MNDWKNWQKPENVSQRPIYDDVSFSDFESICKGYNYAYDEDLAAEIIGLIFKDMTKWGNIL